MPFPKTVAELRGAGYEFLFTGLCRAPECKKQIAMYKTPKGKQMPFDIHDQANGEAEVITHFATCPAAARFSSKTKNAPADPEGWKDRNPKP